MKSRDSWIKHSDKRFFFLFRSRRGTLSMERTTLGWCERGEGWAANLLHPRRARARWRARQIRKAPWRKILCIEITNWMRKIHRVHQVTKRGKPFPRQKKVCAESSWKPPREGRKIRLRSIEVIDYFASLFFRLSLTLIHTFTRTQSSRETRFGVLFFFFFLHRAREKDFTFLVKWNGWKDDGRRTSCGWAWRKLWSRARGSSSCGPRRE